MFFENECKVNQENLFWGFVEGKRRYHKIKFPHINSIIRRFFLISYPTQPQYCVAFYFKDFYVEFIHETRNFFFGNPLFCL